MGVLSDNERAPQNGTRERERERGRGRERERARERLQKGCAQIVQCTLVMFMPKPQMLYVYILELSVKRVINGVNANQF